MLHAARDALRATLRMLHKLTREHAVDPDEIHVLLATGVSREQIEDALAVCFAFNAIDRLADAFGFFIPGHDAFEAGRKVSARAVTVEKLPEVDFTITEFGRCLEPTNTHATNAGLVL